VAATKSFTSQSTCLTLLALCLDAFAIVQFAGDRCDQGLGKFADKMRSSGPKLRQFVSLRLSMRIRPDLSSDVSSIIRSALEGAP